ncbi:MAG: mechanosensitive ion channel family protein [Paracoccaceae bacterium]
MPRPERERRIGRTGCWRAWALAALLAVLTIPPVAVAQESPSEGTVSTTEERVEIRPDVADEEIAARLTDILQATDWFSRLGVRVEDGVVFLTGTTGAADNSDWAQRLANRTDGVVAVVNRIDVEKVVNWSIEPALNELRRLAEGAITAGPLIILALLILPAAWITAGLVARLVRWLLQSRVRTPFLRDVIARAAAFPVFLIGLYIVLQVAGLTQLALSILGGAGVLGIVIGFAFRDIAENFLASLLLSIRRPFQSGDRITVAGETGVVQSMNTRSTVLITPEGNHIQIPNASIFKSTIENETAAAHRRDDFVVGIGYDDTVADAQDLILKVLEAHDCVVADPPPMALIDQLGASTVDLRAYYWFDASQVSWLKLKSALLRQVKRALTEAGVTMPDSAREVIFPQGVPIVRSEDDRPKPGSTGIEARWPLEGTEPEVAASDRDLKPDSDLLKRQSASRVEEGEADLLDK